MDLKVTSLIGKTIVHIEKYWHFSRIWFDDGAVINFSSHGDNEDSYHHLEISDTKDKQYK